MKKNINLILWTIFFVAIFLAILISKMTGYFVSPGLNVTVKEVKDAKILLDYKPIIDITERQNITAEIINTGSVQIEEEMFLRVYYFNGSLKPIGEYLDSLNVLKPGERRNFKIVFVPESVGTYYIQARAKYDSKTTETWGRFDVVIFPVLVPVIQPPQVVGTPTPVIVYLSPPRLEIYANDTFNVQQGGELIISLIVKNLGERDAYELKPYISYPSGLEVSVSPLFVSILPANKTSSFLLYVKVPVEFLPGLYQIVFEVSANETRASKVLNLNVSKFVLDLTQDYREKIISLELVISEVKARALYLESMGFDVSKIKATIELADYYVKRAREFLEKKDFENCQSEIFKALELISQVLIEMETILMIAPRAVPKYLYVGIVVLCLVVVIAFFVLYRKRKEKRPKLLKGLETEKGE
ncbi:MAG: hypothetical protein RMJ18_02185 [Candidatus Aenigmarchaeota archaeon]|nr:hypothetical protein [Candidatus Aenigmarchaeota archaeon]MCX8191083.1 hypothetical protein [Candidatus Aenigmarchaeota archaeon]MDW8160203.1 hypothetical protein [Candidatus Aenigmarchaeota archaeon]